ncbi:MAG: hypothetical protein A2Z16_12155 [Chloroflexi bacterium RBG_16_54_18]|nr:MAG: hypothetical protein A2Z16_12155 [Chloroflexi bacterium RBG_16_54_18]
MELRKLFTIVWKWMWLVVLSVTIAAGSSYIASKAATPLYRTRTTLMIGKITENPDPNTMQLFTSQALAYTYIQLAQREPVLKGAIQSLGLDMDWRSLAGRVSANNVQQTQLLEVSVVDSNPNRAKVLADAIAQQLILLGPGMENKNGVDQGEFTREQIEDLRVKIEDGQNELTRQRQELDAANSARQIQDLQNQVLILESKVSSWLATYSQLLLSYQGGDINVLSVLEEATVPTFPFSPNVQNNVMVAAMIGFVLAVGGAFLMEYLDDTVKNPEDVSRVSNLPTLGTIPQIVGEEYSEKVIAITQPLSPIVESFRILRTNLQFSTLDRPLRSLLVTSPGPSEGKSISMANLAVVLAQSGLKVILVDADLRRPTVHKIFNLSNRHGLTDAILHVYSASKEKLTADDAKWSPGRRDPQAHGKADRIDHLFHDLQVESEPNQEIRDPYSAFEMVDESEAYGSFSQVEGFLQNTQVENLRLLTSGALPPNPAELLGSERMKHLINVLQQGADLILFDSPPCLVVADSAILSVNMDGVLLVNEAGRTRTNETRRAVEELRRARANILGVLLNRVSKAKSGYNYYYYYYYYQDGEKKRRKKPQNLLEKVLFRVNNNHKSPTGVGSTEE